MRTPLPVEVDALSGGDRAARARTPAPGAVPRLALTKVEAAAALGVSVDSFERHVQVELRCVYRGRLRLFAVAELERWLRESSCRPPEAS